MNRKVGYRAKVSAFCPRILLSIAFICSTFSVASALPTPQAGGSATNVDPQRAAANADADVYRVMRALYVPGAAIGIIANGKIVLAKGYGVREVGKNAPVDADTLFDIGSLTKSFTATAMAIAVDDGKLDWDKPVREYLPWFQMYDSVATNLITPRDLVLHRSGVPAHDFIRFSTYLPREELIRRIRYLEPNHTFRERWQYSNLMYVVAGYLAGYVEGTTWENLVEQRVLLPLHMTHSNTSVAALQKTDNFAHPHLPENEQGVVVPFQENYQAVAGAVERMAARARTPDTWADAATVDAGRGADCGEGKAAGGDFRGGVTVGRHHGSLICLAWPVGGRLRLNRSPVVLVYVNRTARKLDGRRFRRITP